METYYEYTNNAGIENKIKVLPYPAISPRLFPSTSPSTKIFYVLSEFSPNIDS